MQRIVSVFLLTAFGLFLILGAGCAPKQQAAVPRPDGKLAVVGFSNPVYNWQLLAGYLEEEGKPVPDGVLQSLDIVLRETLQRHSVFDYVTPPAVEPCEDVVVFEEAGLPKVSAWKYWLGVAKCIPCDVLLVPQVTHWVEREGSGAGVVRPASVTMEFYLIDVKNERMQRVRYEETQQALLDNLFSARKFADRGGKWVTAMRIASDGIEEKLMELGL
ncbi:hypothetical protein [Pseudodesulfovibrio tunisiensis]|uniref:hypothetical protein n=1 Tax=Pseudodesulfovibrio tunisiensis TaxID=463192 RepID=UPI001FB3638E|nr:hypothetical protein [Pseudodesulfovibrio tunisiensis]